MSASADGHGFVWIGDRLRAVSEASVSPFDHGLLTGDGVFETLRVYDGSPFAATRHWNRLNRSAGALGISLPPRATVDEAIEQVIKANSCINGRLRLTVTAGVAPLSSERGEGSATLIIAVSDLTPKTSAARLITVPFRRNEHGALATHKTTSYGENVVALAYAKKQGGTEAIFANTVGFLCEGASSNIFIVLGDRLITPTLASGCLPGITRDLVIGLCRSQKIPIEETDVPLSELGRVSEAFVTSSIREVQPVMSIDGKDLQSCPGETTQRLQRAFGDLTSREMDPL